MFRYVQLVGIISPSLEKRVLAKFTAIECSDYFRGAHSFKKNACTAEFGVVYFFNSDISIL